MKRSLKERLTGWFNTTSKNQSILIVGMPKTGTTALYYSIKSALPDNSPCYFEPDPEQFKYPEKAEGPVMVKTFFQMYEKYKYFEKKILITRDPRDQILSEIMYYPYVAITGKIFDSEQKLSRYLDNINRLVKLKEQDPGAVTVRQLDELTPIDRGKIYSRKLIDFYTDNPDIFLIRYEDMVDDKLEDLNEYLGLKVKSIEEVPEKRVMRTKSYNNWKNWFTDEDADYFKGFFKPYMENFGYKNDWALNSHPSIDPNESSGYLERIIAEAKNQK